MFHPLCDPLAKSGYSSTTAPYFWDRTGTYASRRAYFTKYLIVSSGPDRELGLARLDTMGLPTYTTNYNVTNLFIESQARATTLDYSDGCYFLPTNVNPTVSSTGNTLFDSGQDDISNHTLQAPGGFTQ